MMDWWEGRRVELEVGGAGDTGSSNERATTKLAFDITCTPAQHFTGRGVFDRFKSLWASWVVEEVTQGAVSSDVKASPDKGVKVYFAGDTGYRAVRPGQDEDKVPFCPAFREIGQKFGGFDFAMIPIGYVMFKNKYLMGQ